MTTLDGRFALFDSDDGGALLFSGYRRTIDFPGPISGGEDVDLASVFAALESAAEQGEWVALAVDYGLGACFEAAMAFAHGDLPRLRAWVFGQARQLDAAALADFLAARLSLIPEHARVAGVAEIEPALEEADYCARVEQVRRWIAEGDCYQINLTFPLDFKVFGDPLALYARLRERQPVRYGAFIQTDSGALLSFSPELFFERSGSRVVTRPMKGTASRASGLAEDAAQCAALLASEKERAENIMIVDLLRNDLGRLAAPGQVSVDVLCAAEAYPTLWQMVSTVSAELPKARLFELFQALFPCGSITGAPKIRAMQRIAELEVAPRALYTGALGYLKPGGDCRFNVAIRTLELAPGKPARLGIGSGIVIDADPAREYAECLLKARFLSAFDPGFELIETLRLENGEYPLLSLHLQRLSASAKALGFACDPAAVQHALQAHAAAEPAGVFRVRLSVAHSGVCQIERVALPAAPASWQAVLADEVLDPDDYLLRHKTTARSRYDRALAQLAGRPGVFDAIFLNARGEVCEGARSNVFIERHGVLLTPPLACGLLPGVMRRHLLESGRARESVLMLDDLTNADAVYLANALRGLFPVSLLRQ